MMIHVPKVLTPEQVAECRRLLDTAEWSDGKATVGEQGALVKRNRQLPELSPIGRQLGELILTALARNPLFFSAALPLKSVPPLFNRYEGGESYGNHIDGAVRAVPGSSHFIRTDLSSTLFLTDPADYEGGELVVQDTYAATPVKLPAGDLVLYTAGSLHRVNPVTRGTRVSSIFWTQSMVPDDRHRETLCLLDQTIQKIRARHGETDETVALAGHYHNLLRMWSEI
ncbi:MAG: Fe2+-dependent dioxygenase [Pseudomonadota bacterium]